MEKAKLDQILAAHKLWVETDHEQGERADLSGADLSGADLRGADLIRANLSGADLSGANLSGANLSEADLSEADLSEANLSEANLYKADLYKANLREANLYKADLSEADLYLCTDILLAQSPSSGRITYYHPDSDYIQIGCRKTNLEGFKTAVAETYPDTASAARRGYDAIIELFEVYKKQ